MFRLKMISRKGATGSGYALSIGLISIVALGAISSAGGTVQNLFTDVGDNLSAVTTGSPLPSPSAMTSPSPTTITVVGALTAGDPGIYSDGAMATSCATYLAGDGIYQSSTVSGAYMIDVDGSGGTAAILAYCDMTTDGGGWTRVIYNDSSARQTTTAAIGNQTDMVNGTGNNKLPDPVIRTLATNGSREYSVRDSGTSGSIYILRASSNEWANYSTIGWTNTQYDAKNSSGTWINNACNGWNDNRGFSTYNGGGGGTCSTVWSGPARYMFQYHTAGCCAVSAGHDIIGYIR